MSGKFCSIFTLFVLLPVEGGVTTGAGGAAPCLLNQSLALLRFKQGLSFEPPTSLDTWQPGSDCCHWEGVSCDHTTGFVTDLHLQGFQVQAGELIPSLLELPLLRRLDLSQSDLIGSTIPSKLSELTDLTYLDLSGCNITGPIPEFFKQLPNLIELYLSGNSLGGETPPGLLTHPTLRYLNLRSNNLIGRLPEFGNGPSALREVKLDTNMLDGPIPSSIRNLPHLEWLDLEGNGFSGTLHLSLFENLKNHSYLFLSDNKLNVEMPKVVDFHHQATIFPRLRILRLRNCSIKGEFPWFLRNVKSLADLDLSHNNISGIIPKWVWGLPNLVGLHLSHNMLQGFEDVVDISGSMNLSLNLSFNHKFPSKSPMKMVSLDLSNNNIGGAIPPAAFGVGLEQ
ncbi:Polygalacturonase inhibitor 2 [Nymphaea thermarum]|nr:Polygalacturonase inhibitor 2 [Nymphaea thermarum]